MDEKKYFDALKLHEQNMFVWTGTKGVNVENMEKLLQSKGKCGIRRIAKKKIERNVFYRLVDSLRKAEDFFYALYEDNCKQLKEAEEHPRGYHKPASYLAGKKDAYLDCARQISAILERIKIEDNKTIVRRRNNDD